MMKNIYVSKAVINDLVDVYKWRNNLLSRKMFKNNLVVKYFNHKLWFFNSLRNKAIFLTICKKTDNNLIKVGVVRFNYFKNKKNAEVSINLSPSMRGKGLGLICLKKSIDLFKKNFSDCKTLNAFVKLNNIPSIKIFKSLGFEVIKRKNSFMSLVFRF